MSDVEKPLENGASNGHAVAGQAAVVFELSENKDNAGLQQLGGVEGAAKLLGSSLVDGLKSANVQSQGEKYGFNKYKETPPKSFIECMMDNIKDPILWLLMFAATVSTVLGAAIPDQRKEHEWAEGVAIWMAVIIVNLVGAVNDYQKDQQFRKLNAQKEVFDVKVIRDGHQVLVPNGELVVGDVVSLTTGDKVSADCILIETFGLVIDEAALTGESDPIKKTPSKDPWVRSGTQVTEGSGKLLVVAVGEHSEWGRTMTTVSESGSEQTPLQEKLEELAGAIGKVGSAVAVACFIVLLIKWCVHHKGFPIKKINENGPIQFFMYAITIVVVSIPEGLPLAVTISLAYSMKKMMKDNNFVRVLAACETMGGATAICSDKTGTLTENRMTVVEGWFQGESKSSVPEASALDPEVYDALSKNIALNSKAFLIQKPDVPIEFVGNRTECALLVLLQKWGGDYEALRRQFGADVVQEYEFSSERKMASTLVKHGADKLRLYNKGAAEWVLQKCTTFRNGTTVETLTDTSRASLLDTVTKMASRGLRCIALTFADLPAVDPARPADYFDSPPEKDLQLIAIVGIKDPVRQEVPGAVQTCSNAGIFVRMVTGDNIHTAQHIARECGILREGGQAMEGPAFRALPEDEMKAILPTLQVLARASPQDKHTLVHTLKEMGEVVAVTGDGTNDAPALKESDVGLAMGIAGTEVAKEASDIVIMDDNFSSIVKSVLWGRSVFENIRKFLQFQLTVNLVALVMAFIGAIVGGHQPLTVMQLLWVNLIMDSLGALALATENPHERLLDNKPAGRSEPLINRLMAKHILVQGCYQVFWLMLFLYGFPTWWKRYEVTKKCEYELESVKGGVTRCVSQGMDHLKVNQAAAEKLCGFMFSGTHSSCKELKFKNNKTICSDGTHKCSDYKSLEKLSKHLGKKYDKHAEKEMERALSLLFNTFIFMQVANEINCRRIQDEYNIFEGFLKSPTFIAVIAITVGCQVIIMQTPVASFFKVVPINGIEWAISIAIGIGSIPVSLITRFISRTFFAAPKHAAAKEV